MLQLLQKNFYSIQIGLGALFVVGFFLFRPKSPESNFRVREADLKKKAPGAGNDLASAKMKRSEPLALPGIRIDGEPHEILGVRATASAEEIQKAFRELMMRYHPDRVGRPGSREWQDAQKIAEAVIRAKDEMLRRAKARKP